MDANIENGSGAEPDPKPERKLRYAVISCDKLIVESKHDDYANSVDAAVEAVFPKQVKDMFKKSKSIPKMRSYFIAQIWDD